MNHTHKITVTGRQRVGSASDQQQFRTTGQLLRKETAFLLSYDEIREDHSKTHVSLKLDGTRAVMIRTGAAQTRMEFDPARTTLCNYNTGAGILPLEIKTHTVSHHTKFTDEHICLNYTLYCDGNVLSENEVEIRVSPIVR